MDNAARSQRTRNAALNAAAEIVSRDGPGRLTLDAIARESGLSKGAITHQFRTKKAVLEALLERQQSYFRQVRDQHLAEAATSSTYPELFAAIATLREATGQPQSLALAIAAVIAEDPDLLATYRAKGSGALEAIRAEADDVDRALLRWSAAQGLLLDMLFGMSPLGDQDRDRLFTLLLDDGYWAGRAGPARKATGGRARTRRTKSVATNAAD